MFSYVIKTLRYDCIIDTTHVIMLGLVSYDIKTTRCDCIIDTTPVIMLG